MKNTGQKGIKLQHKFITFLREKQEFSTGYYLIKTRYKKATILWSSMERETMAAEVAAHALWGTAMAVPWYHQTAGKRPGESVLPEGFVILSERSESKDLRT